MTPRHSLRSAVVLSALLALMLLVFVVARARPLDAQDQSADEFYDSHFHLTNYIQQGIEASDFLKIMGTRVARSTLFGIPLQQQWSYANSGDFAPIGKIDAEPVYLTQTKALLARHPKTSIIWAHTGLGRIVRPVQVSA
jgi:hypothetical protein